RRRRCILITLAAAVSLTLLLALLLAALCLRPPTTRLLSATLAGVAPRFSLLPSPSHTLNLTLLLAVAVTNPNPASAFAYPSGGAAAVSYRGREVGEARIEPGEVPAAGDAVVRAALTLQADRLVGGEGGVGKVAEDVESGAMEVEAVARVPGTVVLLGGVIRRAAVARSECTIVFDVLEARVVSHRCRDRAEL
ncbi:hypothetical protein BRADI_4g25970v3, partial [Brachypodium distachyon]